MRRQDLDVEVNETLVLVEGVVEVACRVGRRVKGILGRGVGDGTRVADKIWLNISV